MSKTMAEVLARHWSVSTHADKDNEPLVDKCDGCGKVLHTWGDQIPEIHPLTAHQAAALSAAGFGLVADAKAEALEEAAATIAAQRDETNPGRSPEEAWSVVDHRDGRFLGKTVAIRLLRARAAALRGDS